MTDPAFFGYGSLVNLATHDYANPVPATLKGWRRVWRTTRLREVAFLSVEPCTETTIRGIIAHVPGSDWAALDAREAAYQRRDVTNQTAHDRPTAVYQVAPTHLATQPEQPILRSYLDVVIQGYLHVFGEDGVAHFFETTHDWQPISDDRAAPQYPRHQTLSTDETALVDHYLNQCGLT
ncbi:gamma-glutamylcyclotransferase family protein [Yoonia sp. BS5-3]|uniref:Gamma-glutamylcyclotransferase family protein n=1 Tax=Yoonia phaeophyticola TaxID=3137369 RepID=A0ABZ2V3R9_9RHOB